MYGPSRLRLLGLLPCAAMLLAATTAFAQAPAPVPPATPAASAPPAQAATAPPASEPAAPVSRPAPAEATFDLAEVLRREGEPLASAQAAKLAVASAPSIESARAATQKAREAASEVFVAVYPRIELQASYTRLSAIDPVRFSFTDGMGNSNQFELQTPLLNQYMLQARMSYPVSDLFASALSAHQAAKDLIVVERHREQAEAQSVALQARESYYEYARARASLEIARAGLAQTEAQRKDTEARVEAGTLAKVELMRAEARVAAAAVTLARAEGGVAVARTALNTLLHRDATQEFAIIEDLTGTPDTSGADIKALQDEAFSQRPELLALRALASSHGNRRDAYEGEKWPTLSLVGSSELADPNPRSTQFEREWNATWSLGAVLSWSPNEFATADARSDQVGADIVRTEADMHVLEDAVRLEITRAVEARSAAAKAMEAASTGIAAAEETYRVRREQFQAGVAVATDLVDAEQELRRARLDLVNAAIDVRIASARLDRAVGR